MVTQFNRTSMMRIFIGLSVLFFFMGCGNRSESLINTAHLDHLFQKIELNGEQVGIIHIYAEYPDYTWTEAPGEGIACVDDVARAAVFYLRYAGYTGKEEYENKARYLLKFILQMQAENGFFYNFISASHTIDKELNNSLPQGNWWSWRALWALSEAYLFYREKDADFAAILQAAMHKIIKAISENTTSYPSTTDYMGLTLPTWLPLQYAADQAALIIIALAPYYRLHPDPAVRDFIERMAEGILLMQVTAKNIFLSGAFLSWKNTWHAYGNSQAEALFIAADILQSSKYSEAAQNELDGFIQNIQKDGFYNTISVRSEKDTIFVTKKQHFPQISYGIRPMVFAALRSYHLTKRVKYARQAGEIARWLFGENKARTQVYDPATGRCFDGIENANKINLNSGAESTIEALLILLAVEQTPLARQIVTRYYQKRNIQK